MTSELRAARDHWQALVPAGADTSWTELMHAALHEPLAELALFADVAIFGQQGHGHAEVPADLAVRVALLSGTPTLVVPRTGAVPDHMDTVVVAWKPTRQCALAVRGAMPLLRQARRIRVLCWDEPARRHDPVAGHHLDLHTFFSAHQIRAEWERAAAPDDIGAALVRACEREHADLLVMGCYGHPRIQEWFAGGVTWSVLQAMPCSVLMAH